MNRRARFYVIFGGAAALLVVVIVLLIIRPVDKNGISTGEGQVISAARSPFTVSGDAMDLITPGRSAAIDLEFKNPYSVPLTVHQVQVRIVKVSAPNADDVRSCSVNDYAVEQLPASTRITVPANGSGTLSGLGVPEDDWPRVGLINHPVNQDGCKGASLELAYTASSARR